MRLGAHLLLVAPWVLAGCARDNPLFGLTGTETASGDGDGTRGDDGGAAGGTETTGGIPDDGDSTAAGASATGSSGGDPPAECGNGRLEADEECDDDREFCVDCVELGRVVWEGTYSQGGPYEDRFAAVASVGNRIAAIGRTRTRGPQLNGVLVLFDAETGDQAEPPVLLTNATDGAEFIASDLFGVAVDGTTLYAAGSVDHPDDGGGLRAAVLEYQGIDSQPQLVEVYAGLAGNVARAVVYRGDILGVGLANWMQGAYGSAEIPTDGSDPEYWLSVPASGTESVAAAILGDDVLIAGRNGDLPFIAATQGNAAPSPWNLSTAFQGGIQALVPVDSDVLVAGFQGTDARSPWVGRYAPNGAEVWSHVLPGGGPAEELEAVVLDDAGNIIVVGHIDDPTHGVVARFEPDGTPGGQRVYDELGEGTRFRDAVLVPGQDALFVVGEVVTDDDGEDAFIMRVYWDS